jgi:hypothetical protein
MAKARNPTRFGYNSADLERRVMAGDPRALLPACFCTL